MILIAPRENTALRPGHLPLVPTMAELSSFASPARRNAAASNACKMILLQDTKVNLPGMILLHEVNRPVSAAKCGNRRNIPRICTLEENRSRKGRAGKSFKMIFLYDSKNNLSGMILLHKKVGGTPSRAQFHCQTGDPIRIAILSDEPERRTSHGFAKSPAVRTYPHSVRDIISLRNLGAWRTCDA